MPWKEYYVMDDGCGLWLPGAEVGGGGGGEPPRGGCAAARRPEPAGLLPLRRETLQTPFADPWKDGRWVVDDSRAAAVRELALRQARVWAPPPHPPSAAL